MPLRRPCSCSSGSMKVLPMSELDAEAIYRELLAQVRAGVGAQPICLVGIHTGGAWVAERLRADLGLATPLGLLDVSFYRDDFARSGLKRDVRPSTIGFEVQGSHIVVVDDVLYTGRTVRAAMNELFDYGRPARIELAALVDRGGRELPIAPNYVGRQVQVAPEMNVELLRDEAGALHLQLKSRKE